ncbi:MAG: alpha/beta hydrolase [Lachnospiraceae bacterium]|jgi:pimeloyl-ACP methyl ester carboxylesterase|nr:alpha/beta hydrolase [Lachnospiraceae bacterium]
MQEKKKRGHRKLKIFLTIIVMLIVICVAAYNIIAYRQYHFDSAAIKNLNKANMTEKQVELEDGSILNYGESEDNGKTPLLLLHGQMVSWEDYANVLPALVKSYKVYALDYYGHGGSSKNYEKYNCVNIGGDVIWFIENVIGEPCILSGHSSGGLIATYVSANAQDLVLGLVLEDPPYFASSDPDRIEQTFAWRDGFLPIHNYLGQTAETNYTRWYLENCYMQTFWKEGWKPLVLDPYLKEIEKNSDEIPRVWALPAGFNNASVALTANVQNGTGEYDLLFGDTFYDLSWYEGFDEETALSAIKCPTVYLHCAAGYGDGYYDANGVLLAACDADDAARAAALIDDCSLIDNVKSGHDIHSEKPDIFIDAIKALGIE